MTDIQYSGVNAGNVRHFLTICLQDFWKKKKKKIFKWLHQLMVAFYMLSCSIYSNLHILFIFYFFIVFDSIEVHIKSTNFNRMK